MNGWESEEDSLAWGHFGLDSTDLRAVNRVRELPVNLLGKRLALWMRHFRKKKVPAVVDLETLGFRLRLHPLDNFCENRLLFMPQFYDVQEMRFLQETVVPGFNFVDIGANVGIYTLFAYRFAQGKGRFLAVEAEPENFRRLQQNCRLNGLTNCLLVNLAVSDQAGVLSFTVNTRNRGENSLRLTQPDGSQFQKIEVQAETLLKLLVKHGFARVDVLKMDIEGHEERVLETFLAEAPQILWPRFLIVESPKKHPREKLLHQLAAKGFKVFRQTETNAILCFPESGGQE